MSTGDPAGLIHEQDDHDVVVEEQGGAGEVAIAARSPLQLFWRRLRRDKVALAALGLHRRCWSSSAVFAPLIVKLVGAHRPERAEPRARSTRSAPRPGRAADHLFGVDHARPRRLRARALRRARLARGRVHRDRALGASSASIIGHDRRLLPRLDRHGALAPRSTCCSPSRSCCSGIGLASACSLGNGCLGGLIKPGLTVVIFVIAFVNWTYIARIIRGQVLSLREKEFVEAARSLGASNRRIMFREILPNLVAPIIVYRR